MKFCQRCGEEIATKDGDNLCQACDEAKETRMTKFRARLKRMAREELLRDCGLVKVRGALGGVYWD
jgi:NMD protein affecting ribosome stability and mRNA decay